MTKKILSVFLVLVVFFGGYAVLPKKYNPLPVNDAFCATNYGGVYRADKTFKVVYISSVFVDKYGNKKITKLTKTYYKNRYYTITSNGYDSTNTKICLKNLLYNFTFVYR